MPNNLLILKLDLLESNLGYDVDCLKCFIEGMK